MSARLQVIIDEEELRLFKSIASREGITLSEWVRRRLREASREADVGDAARKLEALREASRHSFPAPDIDDMLAEIASGYGDLP